MARQARERSPVGIYHVMTRGINKMDLFYDDRDRYKYYDILQKTKEKHSFELYAHCLMSNHVHLLFKENTELSKVMKSIGVRFSMYFNKKYSRTGYLFQDRFRSQIIESENQFLTCSRYIHNNPVKAGITSKPEDYRWSSYQDYLGLRSDTLLDKDILLGTHGEVAQLIDFTATDNKDKYIEIDDDNEDSLEENQGLLAIEALVQEKFGVQLGEIKFLKKKSRNAVIRWIKANCVKSQRELAKVLNISKDIISRA